MYHPQVQRRTMNCTTTNGLSINQAAPGTFAVCVDVSNNYAHPHIGYICICLKLFNPDKLTFLWKNDMKYSILFTSCQQHFTTFAISAF